MVLIKTLYFGIFHKVKRWIQGLFFFFFDQPLDLFAGARMRYDAQASFVVYSHERGGRFK